jgi:DNA-binding NarL/FixJ family response regulator
VHGDKHQHLSDHSRSGTTLHPQTFVFVDKETNSKRFEVRAGPDGKLPAEEAISLLAMQCVVRGRTPGDFRVMISARENLLDGLISRTNELIQSCMATMVPVAISHRQQEVLRGVLQNLSNKEIASKLNIAERTVKFHVSGLLKKFDVSGRGGLAQKAGDFLSAERPGTENLKPQTPSLVPPRVVPVSAGLHPKLLRLTASERRSANR